MVKTLSLGRVVSVLAVLALSSWPAPAHADGPFRFYSLAPCRAVDTGGAQGPNLSAGTTRDFQIRGVCGVPTDAKAVALNVTVVTPGARGHLRLFPSGTVMPTVSTINFAGGETALANGAIVPLSANPQDLSVYTFMVSPSSTRLLLDVTGFFGPPPAP
jgi:hypothetical protein